MWSSTNASPSSLESPTPTFPATLKYKDPNLTGCYAGTGGSTILTLTSGDVVINSPEIIVGAEPRTLSYACSDFFALDLNAWHIMTSFAESPACASYARDFEEWQSLPYNPQVPDPIEYVPGVQNGGAHIPFLCCGGCKFAMPEVQVLYWSTTTSTECFQSNETMTSHANLIPRSNEVPAPADASELQAAKSAVVDGSTLFYPSIYLAIHGAVSVTDYCGVRGNTYYNPTIAIPPGGLSTLSWHSNLIGFDGYPPQTGAYDPGACHTYGVNNGSTMSWLNSPSSWMTSVSYNMGPPYNPILLPPKQLTALDPEWEACTAWDKYGDNAYDLFYGLYDPPHVLNAAPALVEPSTTLPSHTPHQTSPAPQPAGSLSPADPKATASPNMAPDPSPTQTDSPDHETLDTGLASFILQPFQQGPTKGVDDPVDPTRSVDSPNDNPVGSSDQDSGGKRPGPDVPPMVSNQDPGSGQPSLNPPQIPPNQDPEDGMPILGPSIITPSQGPGNNPPDSDLSLLIAGQSREKDLPGSNSAFITISNTPYYLAPPSTIKSSNINLISPNPLGTSPPILTIDGKAYTANQDSQYIINSQTFSPGGSTVNVNGLPYSLASLTTPPPIFSSILSAISLNNIPILTINGRTYTADSASQYIVDGQTLTPGGSAITINNILYSLPPSADALISGSSTIPLDPRKTPDPAVLSMLSAAGIIDKNPTHTYTIDGIPITGNPSTLAVGGATMRPGSPPITVSGHTLSLATAGLLVVDGHTSELAADVSLILPENGQTYTVDGITLIGNANALEAGSMTLTPGSPPLTLSGHTLCLATGGALIVDGRTSTLAPANLPTRSIVAKPTVGPPGSGSENNTHIFAAAASLGMRVYSMFQVSLLVACVSCLVF